MNALPPKASLLIGANGLIGNAIAATMVAAGADVVLAARNLDGLRDRSTGSGLKPAVRFGWSTPGAPTANFQVTWTRDDQLVTWFAGRAWDAKSDADVTLFPWAPDRDELSLGGQSETLCVTADRATWTNPDPC